MEKNWGDTPSVTLKMKRIYPHLLKSRLKKFNVSSTYPV